MTIEQKTKLTKLFAKAYATGLADDFFAIAQELKLDTAEIVDMSDPHFKAALDAFKTN